jgi:hypothetical protein
VQLIASTYSWNFLKELVFSTGLLLDQNGHLQTGDMPDQFLIFHIGKIPFQVQLIRFYLHGLDILKLVFNGLTRLIKTVI